MTNSQNRATQKEGRNSERNNASPNHQKNASQNGGNNGRKVTFFNDNNKGNNNSNPNKGYYAQKHSSSAPQQYFSTSPKDIVTPPNHGKNRQYQQRNHNGSPHGLTGRSPPRSPISFASPAGVSTTTPNLHFAGSKYFDAPSPNALPQPPCHWTSTSSSSSSSTSTSPPLLSTLLQTVESATSKRRLFPNDTSNQKCSLMAAEAASKNLCSDIFSHNLKLLLNVQA
ncbi:proline-rich nuclear receptor coactivator 2 isoform X1 [Sitodiplosis mosellana]|uniref:proline-rich nuclear receptor coactivator 2 isoform X1 n=1 Tax=Sitodiplosis mosellana TaxID=263140 RepID=UPI002443F14B|nr:proline-rich nuclear receptor coactivator 2 isoform X1 [Sitodiplosis mosellana]